MFSTEVLSPNLKRAFVFVWETSPALTIAYAVLVLIQGVLPLLSLYLIKLVVDTVAEGIRGVGDEFSSGRLLILVALSGGVALAETTCTNVAGIVNAKQAQHVIDRMYDVLHQKSIEVDLGYYENSHYYDTLHRAQQEAPLRLSRLLNNLFQLGQSGIVLLAITIILGSFHWALPVLLLVAAIPGLLVRFRYSRNMYQWQSKNTPDERHAGYLSWMLTTDSYAKEIRLFGTGSVFAERYNRIRTRLRKEKLALIAKRSLAELLTQAGATVVAFALYGILVFRTLRGFITLGDLVMFYQAVQRGQQHLRQFLSSVAQVYDDNLFLSNLYEFLAIAPKVAEAANPKRIRRPLRRGIVFHDVSFKYPGGERKVLDGVSLTIRAGEHIALVGDNGAGKTTLIKLLCRLYDPTEGRITVDDTDLRDLSLESLRNAISVLFQDYARYHMSARDNIWLGNIELPREDRRLVQAAKDSGAHEVIAGLENGYDATLGKWFEKGVELSVGEWQKVALARAFARNAEIIVLDEPTSSMDPRAEWATLTKFHALTKGRTAILISHRLSTVRKADHIYLMDGGRVVESGTHADLLRRRGQYAQLVDIQAQHYR